jgi:hypothetical protein
MRTLRRGDCCLVEAGEGEGSRPHLCVVTHTFLEDNVAKLKVRTTRIGVVAVERLTPRKSIDQQTTSVREDTSHSQVHWMYRQDEVAGTPPSSCDPREVMARNMKDQLSNFGWMADDNVEGTTCRCFTRYTRTQSRLRLCCTRALCSSCQLWVFGALARQR